jgi:hypothetical protein
MSEAFSLKQFGFNNAVGDPNQFDYTMQDISSFSGMDTLPPMPNIFNNQTYQNLPVQINTNRSLQPPQLNVNAYVTNPSSTANVAPPPSMPIQNILDNNSEGLFRNNPNNPFFGIPSSMDWTEWNEWNQSNQGNTTWQPLA